MITLPDLPSALIRVALADLKVCEADPLYDVRMLFWHQPNQRDVCYVCLAGAVIAKSLSVQKDHRAEPDDFEVEVGDKLHAINSFRTGDVNTGLVSLGLKPIDLPRKDMVGYTRASPQQFHKQMGLLAQELEEVGL